MRAKGLRRGLVTMSALVLGLAVAASSWAQGMFYREVEKDGRIYVFANGERYDDLREERGHRDRPVAITRPGYGPNGRDGRVRQRGGDQPLQLQARQPGEHFPQPKPAPPPSPYPAGKFSGLMFGDYYCVRQVAQDRSAPPTPTTSGPAGLLAAPHLLHLRPDVQREVHDALPAGGEQQRPVHDPGNINPYVKDAYLKWTFTGKQHMTLGIQPSSHVRLDRGILGPAPHREDAGRPLPHRLLARLRRQRRRPASAVEGPRATRCSTATSRAPAPRPTSTRSGASRAGTTRTPGSRAEAFYSFGKRPSGQDRTTAQGFVGLPQQAMSALGGPVPLAGARDGQRGGVGPEDRHLVRVRRLGVLGRRRPTSSSATTRQGTSWAASPPACPAPTASTTGS